MPEQAHASLAEVDGGTGRPTRSPTTRNTARSSARIRPSVLATAHGPLAALSVTSYAKVSASPALARLTTAAEGHGTDCAFLGDMETTDVDECKRAVIPLGGDTFDMRSDGAKCYFKKCGTYADIKWSDERGAQETHAFVAEPSATRPAKGRPDRQSSTACAQQAMLRQSTCDLA